MELLSAMQLLLLRPDWKRQKKKSSERKAQLIQAGAEKVSVNSAAVRSISRRCLPPISWPRPPEPHDRGRQIGALPRQERELLRELLCHPVGGLSGFQHPQRMILIYGDPDRLPVHHRRAGVHELSHAVFLGRLQEQGVRMTDDEKEKLMKPILEKYDEEASPYYSTARLWDDGILDPLETREALALGIAMSLNAPIPDYKVGIFRM
jgi:hypothetical protein